jgi:3-oxoacyl-[acyl-carrier-protein] synthase-3
MEETSRELLRRHEIPMEEVVLIPHQANRRIVAAAVEKLGLRDDQVSINIHKYGNTTAATIPLACADAIADGKLKKGDIALFAAVGAGFTVGANIWHWNL